VLDATTGQNGLEQARKLPRPAESPESLLTKLDGRRRAASWWRSRANWICPFRYVGIGEKAEDLLPFDAEKFIESLFEK